MRIHTVIVSLLLGMKYAESVPTAQNDEQCADILKRMDRDWVKIHVLGDAEVSSFSSPQDLDDRFCKPFVGYTKSTGNYAKCLKAFSRQLVVTLGRSTRAIHKKICSDTANLEEAYGHIRCMNNSTKSALSQSVDILTSFVTYISKLEDPNDIIPTLCCSIDRVQGHTENYIDRVCNSSGANSDGRYLGATVYAAWADFMDILCGKPSARQETSCKKLAPEKVTAMESAIVNVVKYDHGMAIPFIEIVRKLEGAQTVDE